MKAAHQQKGELDFTTINRVHQPVAWAAMLLLVALLARALGRRRFTELDWLLASVALAILANAVVCGALSNPHDRYGARAVWLAPFVLLLLPWRAARGRPRRVMEFLLLCPRLARSRARIPPTSAQWQDYNKPVDSAS